MLSRSSGRAGFTLVELLIVLVVTAVVAGAMTRLLLQQQRFYRGTSDVIGTRQQLRQAAAMLPADLRGISSVGSDISAMSDSSIEFRSVYGSSVVCVTNVAAAWISLPPQQLARGSALTTWSVAPTANDSIAIYDDGPTSKVRDDAWRFYQITSMVPQTGSGAFCPASTGLVQPGDITGSNMMYQLFLSPAQSNTISVGAAIRLYRRVHYSLYRAADGNWYLGYFTCKPGRTPTCNALQAIGGPFNSYASPAAGTSGVQFSYFDSTGVALDPTVAVNRTAVARVRLVVRGTAQNLVSLSGTGFRAFQDSLTVDVGVRNRQ